MPSTCWRGSYIYASVHIWFTVVAYHDPSLFTAFKKENTRMKGVQFKTFAYITSSLANIVNDASCFSSPCIV